MNRRDLILRGPYRELKRPPPEPEPESEPEPIEPKIGVGQHTLLLADTGAGKTNVIKWRIMELLPLIAAGEASLILIDPMEKGILTAELLRLKAVWELQDKLVLIEPFDSPASINIFQLHDRTPFTRRQAIEKIERTLGTVAVDMTKNQAIPFKFALQALFALPQDKRDIATLQRILAKGITGLPVDSDLLSAPIQQFYSEFKESPRGNEVVDKLHAFMSDDIFASLFDPKQQSFSLFNETQQGKFIIIDCSRAPKIYGQFWIEEAASSIGRRIDALKKRQHVTPTHLLIDEAQEYIGDSPHFGRILNKAREAKLSAFVAFHNMAQIEDDGIAASIIQQTNVKFIARTVGRLQLLCDNMGDTPSEMIKRMADYHFAYFNRGMPMAETVYLSEVKFEDMPAISEQQETNLREAARPTPLPPAPQRETIRPTGVTPTAQPIKPAPITSDPETTTPVPEFSPPPETPQRRTLKPRK